MSENDDVAGVSDEHWATRNLELLHHAIRDELANSNGMMSYGLTDEAVRNLAWAVTTRIDYAFTVRWSPDWVPPGRPHVWHEKDRWHARCNQCLQESPASTSENRAVAWFDDHVADHRKHEE